MPALILTLVLAVVVFLLVKSVLDAQRSRSGARRPVAASQAPAPREHRPRPRRPSRPIDQRAVADHVKKLRAAVDEGLISVDEAAASVVRQSDGQLSEGAARRLLSQEGPR